MSIELTRFSSQNDNLAKIVGEYNNVVVRYSQLAKVLNNDVSVLIKLIKAKEGYNPLLKNFEKIVREVASTLLAVQKQLNNFLENLSNNIQVDDMLSSWGPLLDDCQEYLLNFHNMISKSGAMICRELDVSSIELSKSLHLFGTCCQNMGARIEKISEICTSYNIKIEFASADMFVHHGLFIYSIGSSCLHDHPTNKPKEARFDDVGPQNISEEELLKKPELAIQRLQTAEDFMKLEEYLYNFFTNWQELQQDNEEEEPLPPVPFGHIKDVATALNALRVCKIYKMNIDLNYTLVHEVIKTDPTYNDELDKLLSSSDPELVEYIEIYHNYKINLDSLLF